MSQLLLATPTVELVKAKGDEFDRDPSTRLVEDALGQLRAHFPHNTETSHVLLKVLALNELYSARVLDIDVKILAPHIAGLGIDARLAEGSSSAVDLITHCDKLRKGCYSFATKYCSWHNPAAYPIYDAYVDECLWAYKKQDGHQDGYPEFHRQDLKVYPRLHEVVTQFCSFYRLGSCNFKAIDKFLWLQGESLFSPT
jgi:hypothetical protein